MYHSHFGLGDEPFGVTPDPRFFYQTPQHREAVATLFYAIQQRRNLDCSGAAVGIGVGSAFDLISGDKPRAPRWMQNMGLEWLHRMLLEPRRLGRRYLIEDTPYLFQLARELTRRKAAASGGLPGLRQLLNVVFSGRDAGA